MILDTHSHILPNIDDGATSVDESIKMLTMLKEQGVTDVIATPHFKMMDLSESIDDFLEKRNNAYKKLLDEINKQGLDLPKIHLGAEVLLTMDLVEAGGLDRLCIEGTNIILLEMPYYEWQSWMFRIIEDLCSAEGIEIIFAHVDRYVNLVPKQTYEKLFALNHAAQINADFVENKKAIRTLKKWIKEKKISYIGSDCHGIEYRPPHINNFVAKIEKIAGKDFMSRIEMHSSELLANINKEK